MFRLGLFAHAASSGMAVALTRRASVLRPVSQAGHAGSCAPRNQSALAGRKLHSLHVPECSQTTLDKVCNAATAAVAVAGALTASAFAVFATDPAASMPPKNDKKRKVGSGSASGDDISPASPRRSPRKISTVGRWATARRRVLSPNEGTRGNVRYTAAMSAEREIALAARKAEKNVKEGGAAPLMAGGGRGIAALSSNSKSKSKLCGNHLAFAGKCGQRYGCFGASGKSDTSGTSGGVVVVPSCP